MCTLPIRMILISSPPCLSLSSRFLILFFFSFSYFLYFVTSVVEVEHVYFLQIGGGVGASKLNSSDSVVMFVSIVAPTDNTQGLAPKKRKKNKSKEKKEQEEKKERKKRQKKEKGIKRRNVRDTVVAKRNARTHLGR